MNDTVTTPRSTCGPVDQKSKPHGGGMSKRTITITLEMQDAAAKRLYEDGLLANGLVFDVKPYDKLANLEKNVYRHQVIEVIKGLWHESDDWQELLASIWDEGCEAGAIKVSELDANEFDLTGDAEGWALHAIMGIRNPYRASEA